MNCRTFLLIFIAPVVVATREKRYTRVCGNDVTRLSDDVIYLYGVRGAMRCGVACAEETNCTAFNFVGRGGQECQLLLNSLPDPGCGSVVSKANGRYYEVETDDEEEPPCANGGTWTGSECLCPGSWLGDRCDVMGRDCSELFDAGRTHPDVYSRWDIQPDGVGTPFTVYCYLAWGGWTLIQYRRDWLESPCVTRTDFYRGWQDYKDGFGDQGCDFWLGNDRIHYLTAQKNYKIDVVLLPDQPGWFFYQGFYKIFRVGNESTDYTLTVGQYYGGGDPIGDSMTPSAHPELNLDGMKFSTHDRDNDRSASNCAAGYKSGWWFNDCTAANINGLYSLTGDGSRDTSVPSIMWRFNQDAIGTKSFLLKVKPN